MNKSLILIVSSALISVGALAQDKPGDWLSIENPNAIRPMWVLWSDMTAHNDNSTSRAVPLWIMLDGTKDTTVSWKILRMRTSVDCVSKTYHLVEIVNYRPDGSSYSTTNPSKANDAIPAGSDFLSAIKMLCFKPK